jgi:hypothetical protein
MIGVGLLAALLLVILVITGLTKLVPGLFAAQRDTARAPVLLAIQALPPGRLVWGQAMLG